jgi:hypothetical protein
MFWLSRCPVSDTTVLSALLETWIARKVKLIAVFGEGSEAVHDLIDDLILEAGETEERFIVTTWHDEPIEDVVGLAEIFGQDGPIDHVRI